MEDIDPQEIVLLSSIKTEDVGTEVISHGVVSRTERGHFLVEAESDYTDKRIPVSLKVDGMSSGVDEGDYVVVKGFLSPQSEPVSFGTIVMRVENDKVYSTEDDTYADETSKNKAHNTILEILSDYPDPVPRRFIVEEAVTRGIKRETAVDMIERMESAGTLYCPEQGLVGTV